MRVIDLVWSNLELELQIPFRSMRTLSDLDLRQWQLLLAVVHQVLEGEGVFFVGQLRSFGGLWLFNLLLRFLEVESP